ncbi:hypothetical protein D9M72_461000 [compost metagenome]
MIRIAFLADRPIVAIRPTLKYTSFGMSRIITASTEPMTPSGTTMITATGIDQLSYSAARHRNTRRQDSAIRSGAWVPDWISCRDCPVHS